jgi:hypothetical protein
MLFCGFSPVCCWTLSFIAALGRVYYFYHFVGDVIGGCCVAFTGAFLTRTIFGKHENLTSPWPLVIMAPAFYAIMKASKYITPIKTMKS